MILQTVTVHRSSTGNWKFIFHLHDTGRFVSGRTSAQNSQGYSHFFLFKNKIQKKVPSGLFPVAGNLSPVLTTFLLGIPHFPSVHRASSKQKTCSKFSDIWDGHSWGTTFFFCLCQSLLPGTQWMLSIKTWEAEFLPSCFNRVQRSRKIVILTLSFVVLKRQCSFFYVRVLLHELHKGQ